MEKNTKKLKYGTYVKGAITHEIVSQVEPKLHKTKV